MASYTTLEITGHAGRPLDNTFLRAEAPARALAILFPGYAYRATMPALYYPERLFEARGADVLRVEYAYDREPGFRSSGAAWLEWVQDDAEAALAAGLGQGDYDELYLVGKSVGTLALGHLLAHAPRTGEPRYVWLTPLLGNAHLVAQILDGRPRSLFVGGTADSHYDLHVLTRLVEATDGESVTIQGGDHSLEVPGDLQATLEAMAQIVQALARFCS